MLERADRIEVVDSLSLPVVQIEDIIGLKVQAAVNDPRRHHKDWSDIRQITIVAPTVEVRERYCRWATEAAKFFKGKKPVRFVGDN